MKKIILAIVCFASCMVVNAQHMLVLKSGEKMNGTLQSVKDGTVSFMLKGNIMSFPLTEVTSIQFNDGNPDTKASTAGTDAASRGVSFVMPGRILARQPKVDNLTMEKGIVVVAITINKEGNVIKAEPGAEGTTTTSNYLLTKAKQAAQTVQFDKCPKCPLESQGSITITF